MTDEDIQIIESLKWLKTSHSAPQGLVVIVSHYNELARKFLLEGRLKAAEHLLAT